jgi:hypothetical protein
MILAKATLALEWMPVQLAPNLSTCSNNFSDLDLSCNLVCIKARRFAVLSLRTAWVLVFGACLIGAARAQNDRAQDVPSDTSAAAASSSPVAPKGSENTPSADNPLENGDWQARISAARQRHDDWLACITAKGRNCSQSDTPDPMQALLNDTTLVNGDIVSTPKGLKVFRGQPEIPHRLSDFK